MMFLKIAILVLVLLWVAQLGWLLWFLAKENLRHEDQSGEASHYRHGWHVVRYDSMRDLRRDQSQLASDPNPATANDSAKLDCTR